MRWAQRSVSGGHVPLTLLLRRGQDGWSALMLCARYGHTEAVKALIEAGANKDLQSKVSLLLPPSLPPSLPLIPRSLSPSLFPSLTRTPPFPSSLCLSPGPKLSTLNPKPEILRFHP